MTTVICLPGLLCTPALYDGVASQLDAAVQVRAIPEGNDFIQIAAEIAASLPKQTVLVGTSMGSYLALEITRQAPDRIAGLVLLGCTAASDAPKAAALRAKVVAWAQREGVDALAESICTSMLGAAAQADPTIRATVAQMAQVQGLDVFAQHQTALAERPDNQKILRDIQCPVLVMTGAEDNVTPPEIGQEIAQAVPQGRFALIDGAGHLAALERPQAVADAINTFLAQSFPAEAAAV